MAIPQHVAIIMDGNRRWAQDRGLPKLEGHRHGVEAFKNAIRALMARNIPVATFFAFSRENWRRTQEEISWLMGIFQELLTEGAKWLAEQGVKLRIAGRLEDFPAELVRAARTAVAETAANERMTVNIALSYGGREEILQAAKRIAADTQGNAELLAAVTEETFSNYLYTAGLPDVDLLIRTGGERRLSGFLPWQSVYAELYFSDALWPDFDERELDRALADFSERKRNFGA